MRALEIPGIAEPARVVRHAPRARRLRLEVAGLRGRSRLARRLERELTESDWGIDAVTADPRSGRVLIRYAPDAEILDHLQTVEPSVSRRRAHRRRGGDSDPDAPWHALDLEELYARIGTSRNGLSLEEAGRRRALHGPNAVAEAEPRSRLAVLGSQLSSLPAALLTGSSGLSLLAREYIDAGAILSAVGLDAGIGYWIERQNELLLASWRRLEAGEARVLRQGPIRKVPAADLTVGDAVVLRAGDTVPADLRIIESHRLSCDEAVLTGESEPRDKGTQPCEEEAPLAERSCMLFAGTTVASGRTRAVVTAIGEQTEMARIRRLIEAERAPTTTFERRLEGLGVAVSLGGAASGAAAATIAILRRRSPSVALRDAVALGVAAIPEGLPIVSTSALLQSMKRLRERGMVVRRLVSAETLGGVTVVCADKTGTLTQNVMRVEEFDIGRGAIDVESLQVEPEKLFDDPPSLTLAGAALNCDVELHGSGADLSVSGSPTEKAIVTAAQAAGLDCRSLFRAYPRRKLRERGDGAHYVMSLHESREGEHIAFVKGAPEQVVGFCSNELGRPLDAEGRLSLAERNHAMARRGLRVLAVAWRRFAADRPEELDGDFTLLGLIGLRDPLRPVAAETVRVARRAGIRTVIATGDQHRTAESVARAVGLEGEVIDGAEMMRLLRSDGAEARERIRHLAAISRVTPSQKAELVRALREAGDVVAMAGDGVNDAPALRAADVGIAVGSRASDVAREAADIVLASEDLDSILHAVGEGRLVQDNLRRAIRYLLATNLSEIVIALSTASLGARPPFTPLRLLWLNLLSDTLPAVALGLEPADGDLLARPPAPPDAPLVSADARRQIVRDGLGMAGLGVLGLALGGPAACLSAVVGSQLGYALGCRAPGAPPSERFSLMVGGTAGLHLAAIALPPVRSAFRFSPALSLAELLAFGAGFAIPWAASHSARQPVVVRSGRSPEVQT